VRFNQAALAPDSLAPITSFAYSVPNVEKLVFDAAACFMAISKILGLASQRHDLGNTHELEVMIQPGAFGQRVAIWTQVPAKSAPEAQLEWNQSSNSRIFSSRCFKYRSVRCLAKLCRRASCSMVRLKRFQPMSQALQPSHHAFSRLPMNGKLRPRWEVRSRWWESGGKSSANATSSAALHIAFEIPKRA